MIGLIVLGIASLLGEQALGDNLTDQLTGERWGPQVHTIQNENPYLGLDPTREGNGKYPVIFEPLQNVQMSRSTYKVTSFIDFEPYLQYFTNCEGYLNKFLQEIVTFMEDPVFREFRWGPPQPGKVIQESIVDSSRSAKFSCPCFK